MATSMSVIKRRRRLVALFIFFIFLFVLIWLFFRKSDYAISYVVSDYQVEEAFDKDKETYSFGIKKDGKEYYTVLSDSNFFSKKIIYQIDEYHENEETCIKVYSNQIRFFPLCVRNGQQISYHLVSEEMRKHFGDEYKTLEEDIREEYYQIQVSQFLHYNFYIWNYRGFYHLNRSVQEEVSLFQKDIYDPKLIASVGDYLFIPDYDANYYFEKAYVIHAKTGKLETWDLKEAIYFDSILLGTFEDSIYLVDKHEKVEWKLTPKKKEMERVGTEQKGGVIYQGEWINVSMIKLLNQDYTFSGVESIEYKNENGLFATFANHSILIKEVSPKKIMDTKDDDVFYLVDDVLYSFSNSYGEVKHMKFFEWNFNFNNVVFVF